MLKCIIVEDEILHQKLLNFYLEKIGGVEVIGMYVDTVQAAMNITKLKPDFIFLDINISGLEGPEFVELLETPPKIIVVSAHPEEFMQENYDISYEAYIQKPIDEVKLAASVQLLQNR